MLFRLKVASDTLDPDGRTFQASGPTDDAAPEDVRRIAADLEAGAPARFYRGGQPHGRVLAARATPEGLSLRIRITARESDIWKLVETGAVNTVEIQMLPRGVDVFLKSVAATHPSMA